MRTRVALTDRNWLERSEHQLLVAAAAGAHSTGMLLDVGCGDKPYEDFFSPHVRTYVGLDIPPDHDIKRRPITAHHRLRAVDVYGSAMYLPFADHTFDTVVSFQVLEHVPEPKAMMEEISRVLQPGGHLIMSTPQMWHLHEDPHDYFRFTRFGLGYLCHSCGLEVLAVQSVAGFWARAGLKITYRIDDLARAIARVHRSMRHLVAPLTVAVNITFGLVDRLLPNQDDCAVNFLVARRHAA